ncbi:hypothetical protein COCVIDRAFT_20971 [Bipolaris victoriae FI3]|uniref:Uncharacterized protein n=1 Tax=Bipolaris victoriae (strain FI3) TaxID=930091 RepID=W7E209_BIPV3|nr:hypothetical protein COCVIDRAFT_20971 [Bipolaris victoriae FI3]
MPALVPRAGQIISTILQISTFSVLCICITIVVNGFSINLSQGVCEGGILLCLICYMSTKVIIYYFLVKKAVTTRSEKVCADKPKVPYIILVIMNFIFRINYINNKGICIIGMRKISMLPLIIFEVIVNIYLTALFIIPLRGLHSYKNKLNPTLRYIAKRSLIGSITTLTISVVNLTAIAVLRGEPGWVCLMCCNIDILCCTLVLHWVTSQGSVASSTSPYSDSDGETIGSRGGTRSGQRRNNKTAYGNGMERDGSYIITIKGMSDDSQNRTSSCTDNTSPKTDVNVFPISACTLNPPHHSQASPRLMVSSVITECKPSSPPSKFRAPTRGSWHRTTREEFRDEVELSNITVTRVVEIDHDRRKKTEDLRSEGKE